MTTDDNAFDAHQVLVIVGQADATLTAGLGLVGLRPIAEDGDVTVWGRPRFPPISTDRIIEPEVAGNELLMTIADAALALGLGRSTVYQLIGVGRLKVVRAGSVTRIPVEAIDALKEHAAINHVGTGLVAL